MSILSQAHFHNEAAAIARLEALVWPNGAFCPKCGSFDRITPVKGGRAGLWRCGPCKREFTVKVGTIFESSHVPLHKWFQAAHLMGSSKKGISAHQLHRTLQVTYKTAWFMEHRLREAMRELHPEKFGGDGSTVEIDETYVGGLWRNKHAAKRDPLKGQGPTKDKEPVFALVERGAKVRSFHVAEVNGRTLREIVTANLQGETVVYSDENHTTRFAAKAFANDAINHSIGEYVRGGVHTNTIESYFATLKRGIIGTYHHVSQQHLKRYLAEFDFRYNNRSSLDVDDETRADRLIQGIVGKRLMYKDSSPASV
jgi:transposase-like protein